MEFSTHIPVPQNLGMEFAIPVPAPEVKKSFPPTPGLVSRNMGLRDAVASKKWNIMIDRRSMSIVFESPVE